MPRKPRSSASQTSTPARPCPDPRRPVRVLAIDPEPQLGRLLAQCQTVTGPLEVVQVDSLAQGRSQLAQGRFDVVALEPHLPDGSGLALVQELRRRHRQTRTLVVSSQPSLEQAIDAIRAGVSDFLVKPLGVAQLAQSLRRALDQQAQDRRRAQRVRRLRRACQKLDQARLDISRQVDILCNDLVTAYQELACQVQQVASASEYGAIIRNELDLEMLLRKSLEYLVDKAGPTNAAIFLPSSLDEFSLGGYVNYNCSNDAADILLEHLGDMVAPRVAQTDGLVRLYDQQSLRDWLGDDDQAACLAECDVTAFACRHQKEALAVVILFRDQTQPFDESLLETCASIAPMLGQALARLIRIHHRHLGDLDWGSVEDESDGGSF